MATLAFVNKWVHLTSIVLMLGGVGLMSLILLPILRQTDNETSDLGARLIRRFGMFTGVLWMLILLTGFINVAIVWPATTKMYHRILETKTLAAIIMLALATAISHPAAAFASLKQNRSGWLLVVLLIGVAVLGLSAHLNIMRVNGSGLVAGR